MILFDKCAKSKRMREEAYCFTNVCFRFFLGFGMSLTFEYLYGNWVECMEDVAYCFERVCSRLFFGFGIRLTFENVYQLREMEGYGVATASGIDKIIGLFCRIAYLLYVCFQKRCVFFLECD